MLFRAIRCPNCTKDESADASPPVYGARFATWVEQSMTEHGDTVLVVDDDESIRETMCLALEMRGYRAITANNGSDALAVLHDSTDELPSLILLDLMMPVMDGWAFMTAIDDEPGLSAIPVVVVSAFTTEAQRLGRRSMLPKPVSLEALYETVSRYCQVAG